MCSSVWLWNALSLEVPSLASTCKWCIYVTLIFTNLEDGARATHKDRSHIVEKTHVTDDPVTTLVSGLHLCSVSYFQRPWRSDTYLCLILLSYTPKNHEITSKVLSEICSSPLSFLRCGCWLGLACQEYLRQPRKAVKFWFSRPHILSWGYWQAVSMWSLRPNSVHTR